MRHILSPLCFFVIASLFLGGQRAPAQFNQEGMIREQIEALKPLGKMNGAWRGTATIMTPTGKLELTQTERVGPLLGGAVKVVEGRGYDSEGKTEFNALGVISYDTQKKKLLMKSYANGRAGEYEIKITDDGFQWEMSVGTFIIRYEATLTEDSWTEVGQRIVPGQEPMTFFEMQLQRIGETDWPIANPVAPK